MRGVGFPSVVTREAGTSAPRARRPKRRLSASHLLIAVVAVLAFALNYLALRDGEATTLVAIADRALAAGSMVGPDDYDFAPVASDFAGLESLLTEPEMMTREGWVLASRVPAGGVIGDGMLIEPGAPDGLRAMSIPVEVEHAAGGALVPGDRVDVISTIGDEAVYVVSDVEVLSVADRGSAAFGAVGIFHIVVGVDSRQALALAEAIEGGPIEVVRSTGADAVGGDRGR